MKTTGGAYVTLTGIGFLIAFTHLVNWLIIKAIIWIVYELFNINWYGKFWIIYVACIIIELMFSKNKS